LKTHNSRKSFFGTVAILFIVTGLFSQSAFASAPVITSPSTVTVVEGTPISTTIYTVTATETGNPTLTYSLSGTDASAFTINSSTGVVTLRAISDYQTKPSYSLNVIASDGTLNTTEAVTVNVTDVAPTITSASFVTVVEGTSTSTPVFNATATDVVGSSVTYSLTGTDASVFNINAATGAVTLKAIADYQTKISYSLNVIASDGTLNTTAAVTVSVTDVAPTITSASFVTVVEGTPISTPVFTASATDVVGSSVTYSLSGTDASAFNINAVTGAVTLRAIPDYQTKPSYNLNVIASDGTLSTTAAVTVNVIVPVPVLSSELTGTNFILEFSTVSGQSYTVQQNVNLATTNWISYTNVTGDGTTKQFQLPVMTTSAQYFFRVSAP
jgi:hypothetical protein